MLYKSLPLMILLGVLIFVYLSGALDNLNLQYFQDRKLDFQAYTAEHPILSALVFCLSYIAAVAFSLPIATLLTLLGGFLFGLWWGTLLVITSATIGACILFTAARTSIGQTLRQKAGELYKRIETNMRENAVSYMLFMRLVPLFPFFLVNIVPALFNVSLRSFALTTFFGIIPGSMIYINVGQQLGDITSLNDLVSRDTLLAFALLGLLALTPTLYKTCKKKSS